MTTGKQTIEASDAMTSGTSDLSVTTTSNNSHSDRGSITASASVASRPSPHQGPPPSTASSKTKTTPTPTPTSSQASMATTRIKPNPKPTPKSISTLESELASLETQLTTTLSRLAAFQQAPKLQQQSQSQSQSQPHSDSDSQPPASREQQILDAQAIFTRNIAQLRRYNDVKDAAMGMLSLIAEREGKRVAEVLEERGVAVGDD